MGDGNVCHFVLLWLQFAVIHHNLQKLHVQISNIQSIFDDEVPTRFNHIAH